MPLRAPRFWDSRGPAAWALLPLACLYAAVSAIRRRLYRWHLLRPIAVKVPVIVVGNITAGGTGKTPLVLWMAKGLASRGWRPGIITRGYGGKCSMAKEVLASSDPLEVGDEAVLLARRSGCPVWRGTDRVLAGRSLLSAHPDCNCLISDDGLQHYRLSRQVEIAVVDGARGLGNRLPLPSGPLREPASRLDAVDAVVVNGMAGSEREGVFGMQLGGDGLVNMVSGRRALQPTVGLAKRVHAVAGIGNPGRFFQTLRSMGLEPLEHPFPDHHAFVRQDLLFSDGHPVVMTEKDAVKCSSFAERSWWYLPVTASVDTGLLDIVLERIGHPPMPPKDLCGATP